MSILADKQSKGTQWASLFIDRNTVEHFNSFVIEQYPQDALNKIKYKSITRNLFTVRSDNSVMCGIYGITF